MASPTDSGNGSNREPVMYGVVRFGPGGDPVIAEVVISFSTQAAANLHAIEQRWGDCEVTPLRYWFVTDDPPQTDLTPQASRLYLRSRSVQRSERRDTRP